MRQHKPFEDCIAEYRRSKPFELIPSPDAKTHELRILKPPPIEISILAGEVLYQLRSALDHLFFELVERHHSPLTSRQIRECAFPLRCDWPVGYGPVAKHNLLRSWQGGIPDDAFALIEGVQPYHKRHDGHRLLAILARLSNIDKHRRLNATITRIDRRETMTNGIVTYTMIEPMLNHGAQVSPVHPPEFFGDAEMQVESEFIPKIAFDEKEVGPPQTALLEKVVYDLPVFVFNILGAFNKFLS